MGEFVACSAGGDPPIGCRISQVQVARTPGFRCQACNELVLPGQRCRDVAGIHAERDSGFFARFHFDCFDLYCEAQETFCPGEGVPWWPWEYSERMILALSYRMNADQFIDWYERWEQTLRYANPSEEISDEHRALVASELVSRLDQFSREQDYKLVGELMRADNPLDRQVIAAVREYYNLTFVPQYRKALRSLLP